MGVFYSPGRSGAGHAAKGSVAVTRRPHLANCSGRRWSIVTNELLHHLGPRLTAGREFGGGVESPAALSSHCSYLRETSNRSSRYIGQFL